MLTDFECLKVLST